MRWGERRARSPHASVRTFFPMTPGPRRLIGTLALLAFILVYVLVAMVVASAVLPGSARVAEFLFYAVAGLAWVPLAAGIISWTYRR